MTRYFRLLLVAGAATLLSARHLAGAQSPSVYAASQAGAGRRVYQRACASCHGRNLDDGNGGPPLKGEIFQERWSERTVAELFDLVSRSMPPSEEKNIRGQEYVDVLAFLLQSNGVPAGRAELSSDPVAQERFVLRFE